MVWLLIDRQHNSPFLPPSLIGLIVLGKVEKIDINRLMRFNKCIIGLRGSAKQSYCEHDCKLCNFHIP